MQMTKPLIDLPSNSPSPLCVHINRNGFKESLHQVDVAVCDADGSVIFGMGDLDSVIFPRSAMKPLQSIALIELLKTLEDIPEFSEAEVASAAYTEAEPVEYANMVLTISVGESVAHKSSPCVLEFPTKVLLIIETSSIESTAIAPPLASEAFS